MRRWVVMIAALVLASPAFAAERPNIVLIGAVDGILTRDSTAARAFEAGLLAVEALHRRSGDLGTDTRVRIDQAVRKPLKSLRGEPIR